MDSIFVLEGGDRASFLSQIMQSFGCVYICLWSYLPPPSKCLLVLEGLCGETSSEAKRFFDVYRESVVHVDTGRIPGIAFKNNIRYMEVKLHDFHRLVSCEVQLQFYREAGIKTVVFMGCATGEIELGMTNDPQADLEKEMTNLISSLQASNLPHHPPSSCSSSRHSLSVESSDDSPLAFNVAPLPLVQPLVDASLLQKDEARQAIIQIRNAQLPTIESEDAALTKAILAVLSSSAPSRGPTAFTRYAGATTSASGIPLQKQNKFKRAVSFFRNLNLRRRQEFEVEGNRPSVTQLQHMISERRRREKLNESFNLLRSLLPPGSKKDKASVLSSTSEYLSTLKSEVVELVKKNQMLESQLSARKYVDIHIESSERVTAETTEVSSSSSEARFLDLRVSVRGESSLLDLTSRLIELLKRQRNVSLLSLQSNTSLSESVHVHGVMMRLKIEGEEFDISGFEEGVRRVADDQAN